MGRRALPGGFGLVHPQASGAARISCERACERLECSGPLEVSMRMDCLCVYVNTLLKTVDPPRDVARTRALSSCLRKWIKGRARALSHTHIAVLFA